MMKIIIAIWLKVNIGAKALSSRLLAISLSPQSLGLHRHQLRQACWFCWPGSSRVLWHINWISLLGAICSLNVPTAMWVASLVSPHGILCHVDVSPVSCHRDHLTHITGISSPVSQGHLTCVPRDCTRSSAMPC